MDLKMPRLLHLYLEEPLERQLKVKRLLMLELIILSLMTVGFFFVLAQTVMIVMIGSMALVNGLAVFMLVRGKNDASEILHFFTLALIFVGGLLFATDRTYDLPFFILIGMLALLDILLTTSRSWRLYFFVALMVVVPVVSRQMNLWDMSLEEKIRRLAVNELVILEIIVATLGGTAILLYRDSRNLLTMMLIKTRESEDRYQAAHRLLAQSQDSLEIGETLEKSSDETLRAVHSIREDIQSIRDGILSLDEVVDKYSENSSRALGGADELEQASQDQSASVSETASIIEEMAASIRNVSEASLSRRRSVDGLVDLAVDGMGKMREMDSAMEKIQKTSMEIIEVISIIEDVASRTNLLAMNAAIEAAHAGDSGRGFAVVADEIRKLSEATNDNTKRIKTTIDSANDAIGLAVDHNTGVRGLMETLRNEVEGVSGSIGEIVASLEEMSSGTHEVNTAVVSIRDLSIRTDTVVKDLRKRIVDNDSEVGQISDMTRDSLQLVERSIESFEDIAERSSSVRELGSRTKVSMEVLTRDLAALK